MRRFILFILIPVSLLLVGCPRAAKYSRPQLPVREAWPEDAMRQAEAPEAKAAYDLDWKEYFADERLQAVIQLALENNRDLRIAAFNIEKAQALFRIERAEQYPKISASASSEVYRLPSDMSATGKSVTAEQHTVNLGVASWELDFFGRIRSLKSSALEQYLATEQAHSAARISLVASVANAYLGMAADLENLRLAEATLTAQQSSWDLIRQSRDLGIASDLEVTQAETQVEAARVDIARYSGRVAQDRNLLDLLAGGPVPPGMLPGDLTEIPSLKELAAGVPSEVLLRRPDILMAEHQLKAYSANIGAARAAYFPRISLTAGAAGFMSTDLVDLFKYGSRTWSFIPQVTFPIFDSGARAAGVKVAEADRNIAVAEYEKAIQTAFREVSDALSLRTTLVKQQNAQESLVDTLDKTYRLSEARYQGGIDSYLSVLVAQRSLYAAQQQLVGTRLARLSNLAILYKVLGGGA
jgi:multidrug efflux system outer membrane protein